MTTDPATGQPRDIGLPDGHPPAPDDLAQLRRLLFGAEQQQLARLVRRLDDPDVRAAETSAVLSESVRLAVARGPGLSVAITPIVEEAIHTSVRRDPARLVDAIFPVMGPAIRRSIATTLRDMIQSLNDLLESSVSWRGVMWRIEARRSGKPFAEVALLHTLVYQAEQVFLIHARTGLLLQHVVATTAPSPDPHVVSGMLTAIQDFVNESFNAGPPGTLETMSVGELTVWIEPGPHAYLAAIVRGHAPIEFRTTLQDALANIHREHAQRIEGFEGDAAPFEACRPALEACLKSKHAERRRGGVSRPLAAVMAISIVLVGLWAFQSVRNNRRWSRFVDRLRAESGLVLVTAERRSGRYVVSGLRDPLAADPAVLQAEAGYAPDAVAAHWTAYQAAEPRFVVARARTLLAAPPTVALAVDGGVPTVSGTAPRAWMTDELRLARFVPGVTSVVAEGLRIQEVVDAETHATKVEQHQVFFQAGSAALDVGQQGAIAALATDVQALVDAARRAGSTPTVEVAGWTDETGSEGANQRLSARRATSVVASLEARGLDGRLFVVLGAGQESGPSSEDTQRARKRPVGFRVRLTNAEAPWSGR